MRGISSTPTRESIVQRAFKRGGTSLGCFFSVFLLVGGVMFFVFFVRPALQMVDAEDWIETSCVIISSEVGIHRGSDSTTYSVDIVYTYRVNGREHRSDRYDFLGGSSSGYESKAAIVARYPPGQRAVCYVNPRDPTDAVLERGFVSNMFFGIIPLLFFLVGAGGLFFTIRAARRKKGVPPRSGWKPAAAISYRPAPASSLSSATAPRGPVVLEAKMSPKGKLIGATIVSLFWNGILSAFVWFAYESWQSGEPEWFLSIFLIPFALIGLGLIGAVGYFFLGLFNPRPNLTVSSDTVPLGGTLNLQWQISGRAHLIERLRIYLEGREEATYRRGTKTYTDRETFATIEIADSSSPSNISWGEARLSIPRDTMHSFHGHHNKIVWELRVRGDIKRWPDIEEDFEMTVLPMKLSDRR